MEQPVPLVPASEIAALHDIASQYYSELHRIEREYLDPLLLPPYKDGKLDRARYIENLGAALRFAESDEAIVSYPAPTPMEPDNVSSREVFGYIQFEARRRLRAVYALSEQE